MGLFLVACLVCVLVFWGSWGVVCAVVVLGVLVLGVFEFYFCWFVVRFRGVVLPGGGFVVYWVVLFWGYGGFSGWWVVCVLVCVVLGWVVVCVVVGGSCVGFVRGLVCVSVCGMGPVFLTLSGVFWFCAGCRVVLVCGLVGRFCAFVCLCIFVLCWVFVCVFWVDTFVVLWVLGLFALLVCCVAFVSAFW